MERRGLSSSPKAYYAHVSQRVVEVAERGERAKYAQYLPAYLLRCIQEHVRHHGDELYDKLKRIRNFIEIAELRTERSDGHAVQQRQFIKEMQHLHEIAAPVRKAKADPAQMKLW